MKIVTKVKIYTKEHYFAKPKLETFCVVKKENKFFVEPFFMSELYPFDNVRNAIDFIKKQNTGTDKRKQRKIKRQRGYRGKISEIF